MCFDSGADEAEKEAKRIRKEEAARQERIRQGTAAINRIFSGGTTGTGQLTSGSIFDPSKTYYTSTGEVWKPSAAALQSYQQQQQRQQQQSTWKKPKRIGGGHDNGMSGGGNSGQQGNNGVRVGQNEGAPRRNNNPFGSVGTGNALEREFAAAMKSGLYSGTQTSPGTFNDAFFNNRRNAYINYAMPQLDKQRTSANRDLIFALDRSGNLASSSRAMKEGELQELYDTNKQNIADKGQEYANTAKTSVEDARQDLIKTLNVTGDAQGAASGAINRASALSAPDTYSPLSQLFSDFTASLGTQLALERAEAASGRDYARHSSGLFKPGRTSVTL